MREEDMVFCTLYGGPEMLRECTTEQNDDYMLVMEDGTVRTLTKPEISIGRDPQSYIYSSDMFVARRQAHLRFMSGRWYLIDDGSKNGTTLNGERLRQGIRYELHDGDRIVLSNRVILYFKSEKTVDPFISEYSFNTRGTAAEMREADMVFDTVYGGPGMSTERMSEQLEDFMLVLEDGTSRRLTRPEISIGRDIESFIYINSNVVNRWHAHLEFASGRWYLIDDGSKNGTTLNGERLRRGMRYELHDGDRIVLSNRVILYFKSEKNVDPFIREYPFNYLDYVKTIDK